MPDPTSPPAAPSAPPETLLPVSGFEKFLEDNFKKIMLALLLLALVVAAVFVSRYLSAQKEQEAAEYFTSASTVEDCDLVVQKHPGTAAAGNALLIKADLLWQDGKKESSINALQDFLKTQPKHKLRDTATLALGTKQFALGEKDAARATFEGFLKNSPQSELAPSADIHLADILWQEGKVDEAKKHYESLLKKYPGKMGAFNQALDDRLALMGAGLPQKEVDAPAPLPKPAITEPPTLKTPELSLPSGLPTSGTPSPAPLPPPSVNQPAPTAPEAPPATEPEKAKP